MLHRWTRMLAIALAAASAATAETPAARDTDRRAWFATTGLPEDVEPALEVMSSRGAVPLKLSRRNLGEAVAIPADGTLRVTRPGPEPHLVAKISVPADIAKALVVLTPDGPPDPGYGTTFKATVADMTGMRGGDWLFVNASARDVGVQIGDERFSIPPGGTRLESPRNELPAVPEPSEFQLFRITEGKWQLAGASTIAIHRQRMEICLLADHPRTGRIEYSGFTLPVVE